MNTNEIDQDIFNNRMQPHCLKCDSVLETSDISANRCTRCGFSLGPTQPKFPTRYFVLIFLLVSLDFLNFHSKLTSANPANPSTASYQATANVIMYMLFFPTLLLESLGVQVQSKLGLPGLVGLGCLGWYLAFRAVWFLWIRVKKS